MGIGDRARHPRASGCLRPLKKASAEGHDREYLLNAMGVAHKDHAIAGTVQAIGVVTMIAALVWAAVAVFNQVGMLRRSRPMSR